MSNFVFFFGKTNIFSQFYPCTFVVDGNTYCCTEQYMHEQKAILFEDYDVASKIMQTKNPITMKRLGRRVSNFKQSVWEEEAKKIVKRANMAKYSQNPALKRKLYATYPKVLVEANPYDKIWGMGLSSDDPRAKNKRSWRGKNLLGYILTEVRNLLLLEEK